MSSVGHAPVTRRLASTPRIGATDRETAYRFRFTSSWSISSLVVITLAVRLEAALRR